MRINFNTLTSNYLSADLVVAVATDTQNIQ